MMGLIDSESLTVTVFFSFHILKNTALSPEKALLSFHSDFPSDPTVHTSQFIYMINSFQYWFLSVCTFHNIYYIFFEYN